MPDILASGANRISAIRATYMSAMVAMVWKTEKIVAGT
jgi:hypothetical protein